MKTKPERKLLKLKEAGQYLSMSTWQLRKLMAQGKIKFIQVEERSHLLFDAVDLDTLAESLKQKY